MAAKKAKPVDPIVVKIVQAIRPGDVVFIECDEARTTQQLKHLNEQIKQMLPDVRVVILNKGSRIAHMQTLATLKIGDDKILGKEASSIIVDELSAEAASAR